MRVLDAFRPRGATWSGQVISSPPGPSGGPSKTHLLPGGGVPRVHRARSPVPPQLPHFATPRSVHQFAAVAAGAYPLRRPPNAWSPGAPALPGPCYWLVASGTPVGWRGGCLALGLGRGAVRHYSAGSVRFAFWYSLRVLCVCVRSRSRGVRFPPPLPRLVWRLHLARSRCWALVGPFHAVRAPPRVLPRFRAPIGVLGGGGAAWSRFPLTGLGLCAPRGVGLRVRGVSVPRGRTGGGGRPVRRAPRLCGRGGRWGRGSPCLVPSLCLPWAGNKAGVTGVALVMEGVAPIPVPFVLACRLRARSVWRPGALAGVCLFSVVPAGAGGCGRGGGPCSGLPLGRCGPAGGRGDHPLCLGGLGAGAPAACRPVGGVAEGVAPWLPCSPSGGRPAAPYPAPLSSPARSPPACAFRRGRGAPPVRRVRPVWREGGGGAATRPPGGSDRPSPSLCPPRAGNIAGVSGDALVMGGAACILFWFVVACRPSKWSVRCSGALVRVQLCPLPGAAVPSGGGGTSPWPLEGGGPAPLRLAGRGGSGGGGGGGASPLLPAPLPRPWPPSLPLFFSGAPLRGIHVQSGFPGGCGRRVRPSRPPVGQCGGGAGGRDLLALVCAPAFPRPPSEWAALFAPS